MAAGLGLLHRTTSRLDQLVGGPARRRVIVVFACVLALDSADKSTIGASSTQLQAGLSIGKTDIGLLLAISSLIGAVATIPAGMFVDRVNRTRLLAMAVTGWALAMALSGAATNFVFLVLARVALGAVTAAASPAIASLVGDYFPEHERGRIYGYVLSGELLGAGFGFLVAGQFATLSWRAPFFVLIAPTVLVWWLIWRLPEPKRGGASRLQPGAEQIETDESNTARAQPTDAADDDDDLRAGSEQTQLAHETAQTESVQPRDEAVLREDPTRMSLLAAVRYVVRVRSNLVLILASALGYFFFSGVRGFAVEFAKEHYGVSQSVATSLTIALGVGALAGVLIGGRLADALLKRGRLAGRVEVPGVAVLLAGVLFVPALITQTLWLAIVLLVLAALCLGAINPPLDAARLDIIHPRLWGRAEAVRTTLRNSADAAAPVLFGVLASSVFTGSSGAGLEYTFLVTLTALFASAGIILTVGRRTYPQDVAAAARSIELTEGGP